MPIFADISTQNALTVAAIAVGALAAFWLLRKLVKLVVSLVIVAVIAAAAVIYCVHAGYLSREDAEKLNPLNSEQVRQTVRGARDWAGARAKDAAKMAVDAVTREAVDRLAPTNRSAK